VAHMSRITPDIYALACCFIAMIPLLLLPVIPPRAAAILHVACMAPLTSYQLLVSAWRKRRMMVDALLSLTCVVLGGLAATMLLLSQQSLANLCIGNALCTAAVHLLILLPGRDNNSGTVAAVLLVLGGGGMIVASDFVSQRMFQCASFPLFMLFFDATRSSSSSAMIVAAKSHTNNKVDASLLFIRGPIPDFFIAKTAQSKSADDRC